MNRPARILPGDVLVPIPASKDAYDWRVLFVVATDKRANVIDCLFSEAEDGPGAGFMFMQMPLNVFQLERGNERMHEVELYREGMPMWGISSSWPWNPSDLRSEARKRR